MHEACAVSEGKNRYYTWSRLCTESKCLKATVQVCTACMIVSLLTTCMNFNTPPLARVAPFRCKIRESNAEVTLDTKTQQARLPADSGPYNPTCPSLVNCILTIPECRSDHHGSCTCTAWSRQRSAISLWRQSVHKISYCLLLLLCSCFAHSCHDPFIVRSASNLSTVPWFHSICAPSRCSRSPTTVCFCFCSCSCFCCSVGVWVPRGCLCAIVKASSPAQIEATRCSHQVFVRTCQFCISAKVCTHRVCRLYTRSIIGLSPSSCNGTNLAIWTIS